MLPHPKLCMQTEPWHPELCFLLHSGSSDMWHNLLGITGTTNLLLELPTADDLQRGQWTKSRWMLKALVLLLRALCSSLDSPTLWHAGQVTEGGTCLLTCRRITYLPASFDAERVITHRCTGWPFSPLPLGGHTAPDRCKATHLWVSATSWGESHLIYPFPFYLGGKNIK